MNKYYVIFDTNVIISGLQLKVNPSPPNQLLTLIGKNVIIPVYSKEILEEYKDVLNRPEFPFNSKTIGDFINLIKYIGIELTPKSLEIDFKDYDDLKFYEVLMDKKNLNKKLVTGNIKDFPINKNIITPTEMINIINKDK